MKKLIAAVSIAGILVVVMCPALPAAAQALTAPPPTLTVPKGDADGSYAVKWGASATTGVMYVLQESTDPSFASKVRAFSPTNALRKQITRRRQGKTYYYRVMARKTGYADSDWKTGNNGCAVPGMRKAKPPASVTVPASDADGSYTVNWGRSATSGARYILEEATSPDFSNGRKVVYCGTLLSASVTGRVEGITYYYRVRAVKPGWKDSGCVTAATGCTITSVELELYAYKAYLQLSGPLETVFTMDKPKGWEVDIAGMCSTLAFRMYDPAEPLRRIFYFGQIYPVYVDPAAKAQEEYWCSFYTPHCPLTWTDAPVVNPLTVENFFMHWPEIASMQNATTFMPNFPPLDNINIISNFPQLPMMGAGETALLRGVFTFGVLNPKAGQGQFLASVVADTFFGKGGGYVVFGATAPTREFKASVGGMVQSLNSFAMTNVYYNWCVAQQQQTWGAVAQAGQTLSEASDMIWEGWQSRTATQDIMAYRYDDGIRGVEKVWDPSTGNVYEFAAGFYDQYSLNPAAYNISTLQPMPDGRVDLWEGSILNGPSYVY